MKKWAQGVRLAPFLVLVFDQATKWYFPVMGTTQRISFGLSIFALTALLFLAMRYRTPLERTVIWVIASAGVSNTIDVLLLGYVRDIWSVKTLIFNVADVCIVVGALALGMLVYRRHREGVKIPE